MRHLVTGGSGFLGNLIARRLHSQGEKVSILDTWEDQTRPQEIEFFKCDIRERSGVARALKDIDVVHHCVALVPLTKAGREFWEVNVVGSAIAAEESVKAGIKSFIHISSSAVFGAPKILPIDSSTVPHPIEIYGRGKLAGEQAVRSICEKGDLPLLVIRPRTILGRGRLGIFQLLFEWISQGRSVYTIGNGEGLFQFVHADDLLDAYMLLLEGGKSGTYNVGTERFGTMKEALGNLIQHAQTASSIRALPPILAMTALKSLDVVGLSPLAPWHYLTSHHPFYFDMKPLSDLGWHAKYSNDEMLRESYEWFISTASKVEFSGASAHRRPVHERLLRVVKWLS